MENDYYLTDEIEVVGLKNIYHTTINYTGCYQEVKHQKDRENDSSSGLNTLAYLEENIPSLLYQSYASPVVPSDLAALRLWLNVYVDAFGALNRVYHSTAGVYLSLGNMPRKERLKRENMHMIGLAEPCMTPNS